MEAIGLFPSLAVGAVITGNLSAPCHFLERITAVTQRNTSRTRSALGIQAMLLPSLHLWEILTLHYTHLSSIIWCRWEQDDKYNRVGPALTFSASPQTKTLLAFPVCIYRWASSADSHHCPGVFSTAVCLIAAALTPCCVVSQGSIWTGVYGAPPPPVALQENNMCHICIKNLVWLSVNKTM